MMGMQTLGGGGCSGSFAPFEYIFVKSQGRRSKKPNHFTRAAYLEKLFVLIGRPKSRLNRLAIRTDGRLLLLVLAPAGPRARRSRARGGFRVAARLILLLFLDDLLQD
jgi:hypothetical protein